MSTTVTKPALVTNLLLSLIFAMLASVLALWVFLLARGDHDMKLLALGAIISQVSALMSTASTMLVGKDFAERNASAIPPASEIPLGSSLSETRTLDTSQVPVAEAPADKAGISG